MVFSMCIEETTFSLKLSSDIKNASSNKAMGSETYSIEYLAPQNGNSSYDGDPDTLIHLNNFSGTLKIVRNVSTNETPTEIANELDSTEEEITSIVNKESFNGNEEKSDEIISKQHSEIDIEFKDSYEDEEEIEKSPDFIPSQTTKSDSITSNLKSSNAKIENRLHFFCKSSIMNVQLLHDLLKTQYALVTQQDNYGRLPLHILANNKNLFNGRQRKEFLKFTMELLKSFPNAIQILDDNDRIPFTNAINDWITVSNATTKDLTARDTFLKSISNLWTKNITVPSTLVELPQIVKWSFEVLSCIIEMLERTSYQKTYSTATEVRKVVLDNITSIPNLLKTVLLIDDNSLKYQILEMPVFQRILLRTDTVDHWLIGMLANGGIEASRAIDYFDAISSLTAPGALGLNTVRLTDKRIFFEMKEGMIQYLSTFPGIISSIFFLSGVEKRRATSKYVVQRILHLHIANPMMIALIMLDLCFNTFLLVSYPFHIDMLVQHTSNGASMLMIFMICIYFLIRDNLANVVMAQSYKLLFRTYSLFTEIMKNVAILFTLGTILKTYENGSLVYPITVGLLWMRFFISYIEVNVNLATFILSVGEIMRGMKSFLVFLFLGCAMFSEMVKMDYDTNANTMCAGVDPTTQTTFNADFCSDNHFRAFFRGYTLIAGDMTAEHYRISSFATFSYVLYTLIGIIVLLNILIAIILDIYQKSFSQRETLLARERLFLLSKHAAIESSFKKFISEEHRNHKVRILFLRVFFILFVIFFQIGFILFLATLGNVEAMFKTPLLSILIIMLYIFIINVSILFFSKELFHLRFLDRFFDTEISTFKCLAAFRTFCKKFIDMLLGFKKFQAENEGNGLSVKTMKELFKESEKRLLSKLTENRDAADSSLDGFSVIDPSISFL